MNTLSGLIIDMRIKEKRRGGERITVYGKIVFQRERILPMTRPSERVRTGDRPLPRTAPHFSGKRVCFRTSAWRGICGNDPK